MISNFSSIKRQSKIKIKDVDQISKNYKKWETEIVVFGNLNSIFMLIHKNSIEIHKWNYINVI